MAEKGDTGTNGGLSNVDASGENAVVPDEKALFLPEVEIQPKLASPKEDVSEPADRFNLVYFIMVIHGIGTLMPWNMFITATAYFVSYKLGDEESDSQNMYQKYFLSAIGFVSQIPNVLLNLINCFCQCGGGGGNLAVRIMSTIIAVVVLFTFTVVLAMLDSSEWKASFFWITMISVVFINMANGMYQNSIYGTAACLPMKYTNAVVLGSNTSGTIAAVLSILSIAMSPNPRTAAIYYFIAAIFVLILAFDSYFILPLSDFYCYHRDKAAASRTTTEDQTAPPFLKIFRKCIVQHLSVWFVFFVTLTCFPAIQAGIRRSTHFPINDTYYTPVTCFLFFNFFAMLGNLVTEFAKVPGPRFVWIPVILRALFIPFFVLCNFNPDSRRLPIVIYNDYVYILAGIVMAFTSGYFSSLCMMYAPRCVEDKHKGTAGMMAAFFLIFGIFSGVCFSFVVIAFTENVGNYVPPTEAPLNATTAFTPFNVTTALL